MRRLEDVHPQQAIATQIDLREARRVADTLSKMTIQDIRLLVEEIEARIKPSGS